MLIFKRRYFISFPLMIIYATVLHAQKCSNTSKSRKVRSQNDTEFRIYFHPSDIKGLNFINTIFIQRLQLINNNLYVKRPDSSFSKIFFFSKKLNKPLVCHLSNEKNFEVYVRFRITLSPFIQSFPYRNKPLNLGVNDPA